MKNFYSKLPNAARAAIATAVFTFVATAGVALMGLVGDVANWVEGGTAPDWSTTVRIVVAAFLAAVSGLLNYVVRYFQQKSNPTAGPHYG